jgi:hypothetical protein
MRLTSTLEELAGDDRRERAQSESSTGVIPSEKILLLLLLSGGGGGGRGATVFKRGWHAVEASSADAAAPAPKLNWSPSWRKGNRRPSLE